MSFGIRVKNTNNLTVFDSNKMPFRMTAKNLTTRFLSAGGGKGIYVGDMPLGSTEFADVLVDLPQNTPTCWNILKLSTLRKIYPTLNTRGISSERVLVQQGEYTYTSTSFKPITYHVFDRKVIPKGYGYGIQVMSPTGQCIFNNTHEPLDIDSTSSTTMSYNNTNRRVLIGQSDGPIHVSNMYNQYEEWIDANYLEWYGGGVEVTRVGNRFFLNQWAISSSNRYPDTGRVDQLNYFFAGTQP